MIMNKIFYVCLFLVFLIGCSQSNLKEGLYCNQKTVKRFNKDSTIYVEISYPYFLSENKNVADSANSYICKWLGIKYSHQLVYSQKIENLIDSSFISLRNNYKNIQNNNKSMKATLYKELSITVKMDSLDFLTLEFIHNEYLGGPHPNNFIYYATFDKKSGKFLKLKDIVLNSTKESNSSLEKLFEQEFRFSNNIDEEMSYSDAGFWFVDNQFHLNNNLAIISEGIMFYYNPYEIGCYAKGPIILVLHPKKIKDMINKEIVKRFSNS